MGLLVTCPSASPCSPTSTWCSYTNLDRTNPIGATLTATSGYLSFVLNVDGDFIGWQSSTGVSCNEAVTLTYEGSAYTDQPCNGYPLEITAEPIIDSTLEGICYPGSNRTMLSGSTIVCESLPFFLEFEMSGVTDDACDSCDQFNDVVRMELSANFRTWSSDSLVLTCSATSSGSWKLVYPIPASSDPIELSFKESGNVVLYTGPTLADWDCYGPNTFTYDSDNGDCDNWPATITVLPLVDE